MKEIEDIIQAYKTAQAEGRRTALATVVHVEGSSYRRPGARMLVTEDGQLTGAISGGCLEGDALRKALLAIQQQQNKLVTYDTTDEDDLQFGVQLGCNGIVHILFEPIDPAHPQHPVALLEKASLSGEDSVIATLFSLNAYNGLQPGTCLLYVRGEIAGRLEDATLQERIDQDVQTAFEDKRSSLCQYHWNQQTLSGLIEWLAPPVSLIIVGAGNDAFPMVQLAQVAGWHITVVDGRPGHANRQRFPAVKSILTGKPEVVAGQLPAGAQTAVVLMTHNYHYDKAMLHLLQQHECGYIGVLGPARKLERMYEELEAENRHPFSPAAKAHIYGPTGLDLGAETAEEIALSIIAEIKMVLAGRNGQSLRDKKGPIHETAATVPRAGIPATPVDCTIATQLLHNPSSSQ